MTTTARLRVLLSAVSSEFETGRSSLSLARPTPGGIATAPRQTRAAQPGSGG